MAFYSCTHDSMFLACEMPRSGYAMRVPWYFTRESTCSHATGNVVHANTRRELRILVSCLLACTRV